jgi:DNA-binding MarR family transcriptional regulator
LRVARSAFHEISRRRWAASAVARCCAAHCLPVTPSAHDARMSRTVLPIREWNSSETDPAVTLVALMHAVQHIEARIEHTAPETGAPALDIARLVWLWQEHKRALSLSTVARQLGISKAATSRLVARAECAGLVECERSLHDLRTVAITLTMLGRSAVHRLDAGLRAAARELSLASAPGDQVAEVLGAILRARGRDPDVGPGQRQGQGRAQSRDRGPDQDRGGRSTIDHWSP